MTNHWCARIHRRGFFFRLGGYGLNLNSHPPLYSQRVLEQRQPWRVLRVGAFRLTVLLPSDLASA